MKKVILFICITALFTGCMDFSRYKTGKVLKTGDVRVTIGDVAITEDGAGLSPKLGVSCGLGKGFEIGVIANQMVVGADIRKSFINNETKGIHGSIDLGIMDGFGSPSYNVGATLSKNISNNELYLGVRYNKYFEDSDSDDIDDSIFEDLEEYLDFTNIQTTAGIKIPLTKNFSIYPEINIFNFVGKGSGDNHFSTIGCVGAGFEF